MSVRFGVIGCGGITKFHFAGLEQAGAQVTWVCDVREETAKPWAEKYGAKYTPDYSELIGSGQVDAILVATTGPTHKPICMAGIEAGLAVVCEKTLAENADDALEIVRAATEKGTIFYTSYMKRFIPAVQKAKELMPELGTIISTHIQAYQCWGDLWTPPTEGAGFTPPGGMSELRWKFGGGILHMGGSHILDLVGFFVGRPKRLYGSVYTPEGRDYDLRASALLETEDAGVVQFEAVTHPLRHIGFLRDGWDERMEMTGTEGRLNWYSSAWNDVENKASLLLHYDNRTGNVTEYRYDPCSPFARADAMFVASVEKGEQGPQSRLTGYDVDELISHIFKSAETGQAVEVNWRI